MWVPDAAVEEVLPEEQRGSRVSAGAAADGWGGGGGEQARQRPAGGKSAGAQQAMMSELMQRQRQCVVDWVEACVRGRPLASGQLADAEVAGGGGEIFDGSEARGEGTAVEGAGRRGAGVASTRQSEGPDAADQHQQLQRIFYHRQNSARRAGGGRWGGEGGKGGKGRQRHARAGEGQAGNRLLAHSTQSSQETGDARIPAIPRPCTAVIPALAHRVFLSYSWLNSFDALTKNHVPPELFEGTPWSDPRRIKLALESTMQHVFGHQLECWLDIERLMLLLLLLLMLLLLLLLRVRAPARVLARH